jgi:hypothetical protein
MAMVSTMFFVATHNWVVFAVGNAVALFLFLLVLVVPKHLLESPLGRLREVRRSGGGRR